MKKLIYFSQRNMKNILLKNSVLVLSINNALVLIFVGFSFP